MEAENCWISTIELASNLYFVEVRRQARVMRPWEVGLTKGLNENDLMDARKPVALELVVSGRG